MPRFLRPLAVVTLAISAVVFVVSSGNARQIAAPVGEVILTVSGSIEATGPDTSVQFDLAGLRALGARQIATSTIWTTGPHSFTGVSLDVLLRHLGAKGATLQAVAVNDYAINIPTSDAVPGGPIIAYEMDGAVMSLRDKGPLWVIYPYDSDASFRSEVIYSRSIWQLDRINVID